MGGVVNRVEHKQRVDLLREAAHEPDVVDRPERVRRHPDGDDPRALGDLARHVLRVEAAVGAQHDLAHDRAALLEADPRSAVRLVIELCDHDLVAFLELAAERTGEGEGERGHVGAERDRGGPVRAEERGHRLARLPHQRVGLPARDELPVGVGVAALVVAHDGVDHRARHLGARGTVEEGDRGAVVKGPGQRREVHAAALVFQFENAIPFTSATSLGPRLKLDRGSCGSEDRCQICRGRTRADPLDRRGWACAPLPRWRAAPPSRSSRHRSCSARSAAPRVRCASTCCWCCPPATSTSTAAPSAPPPSAPATTAIRPSSTPSCADPRLPARRFSSAAHLLCTEGPSRAAREVTR